MTKPTPDLAAFAESHEARSGPRSWVETLPDDVKEQIRTTIGSVSSRVVVRWLQSIGYPQATLSKVEHWRRGQAQP
jgi:ABC-type phosphate/phosphonate transport system substrate-binding protein